MSDIGDSGALGEFVGLGAGSGTTVEDNEPPVCGGGVMTNCCYSWELEEGDNSKGKGAQGCCNDPRYAGGVGEEECCSGEGDVGGREVYSTLSLGLTDL